MGDCVGCTDGAIPPRIWLIRKTSEALIQGHLGLAQIYDEIARSTKVEGDDILFREAAALQRRLAEESKKITVPADMAEEMEKFDEQATRQGRDSGSSVEESTRQHPQ